MANVNLYYLDTLKTLLAARTKLDAKYSIRKFAKDVGVSVATISMVLNRKKGLSEKSAQLIAERLKLDEQATKLFVLSATALYSRSKANRQKKSIELAEYSKRTRGIDVPKHGFNQILNSNGPFHFETSEVQKLITKTEIYKTYRYGQIQDGIHCRVLHLLKDKKTGQVVSDFIQIIFNENALNAAIVYFIKKPNGKFKTYFNKTLDGVHRVTGFVEENQDIKINFDRHHLPAVPHIYFLQLAKNKYTVGKMTYTLQSFVVDGTLVNNDDAFANPNQKFYLELKRLP